MAKRVTKNQSKGNMTKAQQSETVAGLEALIEKQGSSKLLQFFLTEAKAGNLVAPKRAF